MHAIAALGRPANPRTFITSHSPVFKFDDGSPDLFFNMQHERDPKKIADVLLGKSLDPTRVIEAQKRVTDLLSSRPRLKPWPQTGNPDKDPEDKKIGIKALKIFLYRGGKLDRSCGPILRSLRDLASDPRYKNEIEEVSRRAGIPLTMP